MTSKRIGLILMVLFIAGFSFFTIYSRVYVERQKPMVQITSYESATLEWTFETYSTIERAASLYADAGAEWTIEVFVPLSAFEEYMSTIHAIYAEAVSDGIGVPEKLALFESRPLEDGSYILVFSYSSPMRGIELIPILPGEGVTVHLTHLGLETYDYMIPFSAVHKDQFTGSEYIFTVHRRRSAWGWEYYVRRQDIMFIIPKRIRDMANIIPLSGGVAAPFVYESEAELYDGALVRLWD